jgi:imidazolonepropionase
MTEPLVISNAATLVPLSGEGPLRGDALQEVTVIEGASVVCEGGLIVAVRDGAEGDVVLDATGLTVVPGFVDCHTHLPFYGWRADEDAARLAGVPYATLHRQEGGIYRSARLLADATDDAVLDFSEDLARLMLARGTTTFESKSGYGLSVDAELRQLRLARTLAERVPQTVVTTCLAAHAVPHGTSQEQWIEAAATELLPVAAREGLATACDAYVESIAFEVEHAARLAEAASSLGLRMRLHADQLEDGGGAAFAARSGWATADHLNHTSLDAVGELAGSDTAAVLLPGATFTLRQERRPPARALIDHGAIVALGSDFNPGTSPIYSMPFVIALACRLYGLRPLEALVAATVNAAYALGLDGEVGRIAPGHRADMVVLAAPNFDEVPYRPDHDPVAAVLCGGEIVHVAPGFEDRIH